MRENIEELEQKIEQTRAALDETLKALRLRLSPRYQLQRAWGVTRDRTARAIGTGTLWARVHPLFVLTIGLALAGALYLGIDQRRRTRTEHVRF